LMTRIGTTATNISTASAAPTPLLRLVKNSCTICWATTCVSYRPPVITQTMSNTFHTVINTVVHTTTMVDLIVGTVILENTFHSDAPSIRAASISSIGTPLIADDRITIENPVCNQIRMTIR